MSSKLILKCGNAFRKAYFEHARYSNDLDFSTQTEIDTNVLKSELNRVCEYVSGKTGVKFALDENRVEFKRLIDAESKLYEARLYFKGFYSEERYNIKVKVAVSSLCSYS